MGELTEKSSLESCGHSFCHDCIIEWSKKHRKCPLCKQESLILMINFQPNGSYSIEELPEPVTQEVDLATDLEALDHTYFISESRRLLTVALDLQLSMEKARRSKSSAKYMDAWEQRNYNLVGDIVSQLRYYIEHFETDQRIEPLQVLQELYKLEDSMKSIHREPDVLSLNEYVEKTRIYSVDDVEDLSDDSDDDMKYMKMSKRQQRGKPPTNNSKNKKNNGTPKKN